jgi:hypothetical protein
MRGMGRMGSTLLRQSFGGQVGRRSGGGSGLGDGAGLPVGAALGAGAKTAGVDAVDGRIAVPFGSADEVATSVIFAAAVGVVRDCGAWGCIGEACAADALVEFGFFCVDGGDPVFRP